MLLSMRKGCMNSLDSMSRVRFMMIMMEMCILWSIVIHLFAIPDIQFSMFSIMLWADYSQQVECSHSVFKNTSVLHTPNCIHLSITNNSLYKSVTYSRYDSKYWIGGNHTGYHSKTTMIG